jgi:ribosome-associated protein
MTKKDIHKQPATDVTTVEITREPVELYKILKFEGLVGSGADAKTAVASGAVLLNGTIETQKRKKIVAGDSIEFEGQKLLIVLSAISQSPAVKPILKPAKTKSSPQRAAIPLAKRGK